MFVYSLLKAVRKGYVSKKYLAVAKKGYNGILKTFIREEQNGNIKIIDACAVAGLGGNKYRMGDYDYYINEKIRDNDAKAVAPFIMASIELEKLND